MLWCYTYDDAKYKYRQLTHYASVCVAHRLSTCLQPVYTPDNGSNSERNPLLTRYNTKEKAYARLGLG